MVMWVSSSGTHPGYQPMYRYSARTVRAPRVAAHNPISAAMLPFPSLVRIVVPAACAAVLSGCGGAGGAFRPAEGPYLAPGPLRARTDGSLRSSPALPSGVPLRTAQPGGGNRPGMPVGLTAGQGTGALPGAGMPGIGPVTGLVIPVSLGPRTPLRDDVALTREFFGTNPGPAGPTLVEQMAAVSGGLFRPSFEVVPTLVDSRRDVLPRDPTPKQLMDFAEAVVRSVAGRSDLGRFDNDGPDGIPGSRDDDGRLDFLLLVVETDEAFPSVTLRQDFLVSTPAGGTIRSGPIHILSLSRSEVADVRPALGLWLDGLGLDPGERFFPSTLPRGISSLARARLGWLPVDPVLEPEKHTVADGRALLFPLLDVAPGAGFWLVERDSDRVFVSRVARKADGHFFATEAHVLRRGERQVLPLTRQFGDRGSRVEVRWTEGDPAPDAELITVATRPADPVPLRRP